MKRYKFVRTGLKSDYDGFQWEIGKWYKTECREMCVGFNCSARIIDALSYVKGEILCIVETRGKSFIDTDKSTWEEMRIVKAYEWSKTDSVELAIYAAELVIHIYEKEYPNDPRPRNAIEAAMEYLINPTSAARAAAGAAGDAAGAAAWAARAAAWGARDAARDAARAAAGAAAWAARDAAGAAAWDAAGASWDAVGAAAWGARDAAGAAAGAAGATAWGARAACLNTIEKWLRKRIKSMKEVTCSQS